MLSYVEKISRGIVLECRLGEGTFLFIEIKSNNGGNSYEVWVYLANWLLFSKSGDLTASADNLSPEQKAGHMFADLSGPISEFSASNHHCLIVMANGARLEIFADDQMDKGDDLLRIFKDGKFVEAVTLS